MIRAALTGVLVVSIAACAPRPEVRLEQLYDSASAQLWRGELTDAARSAREGVTLAVEPAGPWAWKFKLLELEIHLVSRDLAAAAATFNEQPPATGGFEWAAAKQQFLRGQYAFLKGQPAAAVTALDEAERLADRASAVDVRLSVGAMKGQALIAQRKWADAEDVLNDTIRRAQKQNDSYQEAVASVNLGTAFLFRDRFDDALQYFERVLANKALAPQLVYSVALTNAGVCYYRLGDMPRAIDAQRRAVAAYEHPGRPRVYHQRALGELGTTYLVNGDTASGVRYLQQAVSVAKAAGLDDAAALWALNLANAHIQRGEWQQAGAANVEAANLGGSRPDLRAGVAGEIALGEGRLEDASRLFREALTMATDKPSMQWSMYEGLGRAAIAAKQPAEAERQFDATLRVIEQTRSDLLKADYRLSFLTRLLGFYQRYIDLLVDQRDVDRALAIAD